MYCDEIEQVIKEYLDNPKSEYAVMIDGEWGVGKTYFLTHSLMNIMETIDNGKSKRRKYAYVSLYGIKSAEEVSREIIFQYFGRKDKKKLETADTVMTTASNILTASLGAINIDLSKIKETISKIDINNWIICFDDLERCYLSINEILGYINRLVEHNNCKVVILANEKEIGKINLNQRLENKYQVVMSGRKLNLENESNEDENLDIKKLQSVTKMLFNEDILYKSIREKVIGLTIKFEPQMDRVYDSIINEYNADTQFKQYLNDNKTLILHHFKKSECCNLRTLNFILETVRKVYREMISKSFNTVKYFNKIMNEFLEYIVLFAIYYRNGGSVKDLELTTEIGYVHLGNGIFNRIRGFKFLEKYCTTLSFSEGEFVDVVDQLRIEYAEKEAQYDSSKRGEAYGKLRNWWEKEDDEVNFLVKELKEEIKQNKYLFYEYQGIIGQLMVLQYWKHDVGNIDDFINIMNRNIENSKEVVDVERHSFSFEKNPELRKEYDKYIDQLKFQAKKKNQTIKAGEISEILKSDNGIEKLADYCEEHYNDFIMRYGFIDLLDIDILIDKMKKASVMELRLIIDIFKTVYGAKNINDFFTNDKEIICTFKRKVEEMQVNGINKDLAQHALVDYLKDIIERLGDIQ